MREIGGLLNLINVNFLLCIDVLNRALLIVALVFRPQIRDILEGRVPPHLLLKGFILRAGEAQIDIMSNFPHRQRRGDTRRHRLEEAEDMHHVRPGARGVHRLAGKGDSHPWGEVGGRGRLTALEATHLPLLHLRPADTASLPPSRRHRHSI